jgi:O-antigen biosynthesis protein
MSPWISILTPVYDPPVDVLAATIDSVRYQGFTDWELCLVDDASPNPAVGALLDQAAAGDPRIKVEHRTTNGGITVASADALRMATGEFVALLDHDDLLTEGALAEVAAAADAYPELDYGYSDEAHLSPDGKVIQPFFKPHWSPERLRAQNYCAHLSVIRRQLAVDVGGFRPGFDGSQDYDLILRVTEQARYVHHFTKVLYLWRQSPQSVAGDQLAKPYAYDAGRLALESHAERLGLDVEVLAQEPLGTYRFRRRVASTPLVSIVIPTRGTVRRVWGVARNMVVETVASVLSTATYPNLEVVVVADTVTPSPTIDALRRIGGDRLQIVWFDQPFNFSEKINLGAVHAHGEMLLMLNDDMQLISPDFLETMVPIAQDPGVGMVGAKLYFADDTLQHAGHLYNGNPDHALTGWGRADVGPSNLLRVQRECIGVTAACALMRTEVFDEVGGLTPLLRSSFNDVDLSLKLGTLGYRIVWTPYAELYHFESQSREPEPVLAEFAVVRDRWGARIDQDPYYNPNLAPHRNDWLERPGALFVEPCRRPN